MESPSLVAWLSRPDSYEHHPQRVELVETHISRVFLAGPLVFKLKKPVRFDFLDFITIKAREAACREELRLNRRLAADTYRDVVPVYRTAAGDFSWQGPGEVVDWLVVMRRLPTEMTLDKLHARGELTAEHVERLARVLIDFYQCLAPLPLSPEQYVQRCATHVRGNFRELLAVRHHLPRGSVERVHSFQLQMLTLQPEWFAARVRAGRVVDGHGDLRPEHICLGEPLIIFDCIEFNSEFRTVDVADELAFLATECDAIQAEWVGRQLLAAYQLATGDWPPAMLVDFYKAYRACVRAKVAALRADQLQGAAQEAVVAEAKRHLQLADEYAAPWLRPLVIVVGGLSGTGKTTLARELADALGAELLRTDEIRRELFGAGPHAAEAGGGIYADEGRSRVYEELLLRAAALCSEGISVVLDGTFSSAEWIGRAMKLTGDREENLAVECHCRPEVAQQRIAKRLQEGRDASEARPEIQAIQKRRWQPWPRDVPQVRVDTEQPLPQQVEQVLAVLRQQAASDRDSD